MDPVSHTCALTHDQAKRLRVLLDERGYEFLTKEHADFSAKGQNVNVTVYTKGPKVLIQGKGTGDFIRFLLEPEILGEAKLDYDEVVHSDHYTPHFGIDESGKGDFFGPLVIAGAYTNETIARRLRELGVMDSKRITTDARIRSIAAAIRGVPGIQHAIVCIGPERYNEMHASFRNLNKLLAWGHARVIEKLHALQPDCPRVLSDQFARPQVLEQALKKSGVAIRLEQRTRAESDPAVAAASILAREKFIDWLDGCAKACGYAMPKGASSAVIAAGRAFVAGLGADALGKVAKLHFKTTHSVLGTTPPETKSWKNWKS
jgi:ribonuclease HIII